MIYQFCSFNNEHLIADINAKENYKNIDKLYIIEANRNFHGNIKTLNYNYKKKPNNVEYKILNTEKKFVKNNIWGKFYLSKYKFSFSKYKKEFMCHPTWYNEAIQRNYYLELIDINDNDIYIFSDIDEIINNKYFDEVIEKTKKYGIVTGKLHFSLFYFNLFSKNWGGPEGYSYRLFSMTGKYLKNMQISLDQLRKLGEQGKLIDEIYCLDDYIGFHHSWLGDEKFIKNKIEAYAHVSEHKGISSMDYIKECLKERKSIFPGHIIELDYGIELMKTVSELMNVEEMKKYFL